VVLDLAASGRAVCVPAVTGREKQRMIDKKLLEILVCPEHHTPLRIAEEPLLEKLNQAIASGQVRNKVGRLLDEPLAGGLVGQDNVLLYPIVDDIPVLLVDEAVPLEQISP